MRVFNILCRWVDLSWLMSFECNLCGSTVLRGVANLSILPSTATLTTISGYHYPDKTRLNPFKPYQDSSGWRRLCLIPPNAGIHFCLDVSMEDRWLSVDEIADYLGVAKDTIYTWVTAKGMPGHKVGRFWKFKKEDVDAWVRAGGAASSSDDFDNKEPRSE